MRTLRLILAGATMATTMACGSSPTAPTPTPQPPSILGQWSGGYTVQTCTETGAASGSGFCQQLGVGGGLTFTPQQAGSNLTGLLGIGSFTPISITGTVGSDQVVALQGSGPIQFGATLSLNAFRSTVSGNTMTGTMTHTISTTQPGIGAAVVVSVTTLQR